MSSKYPDISRYPNQIRDAVKSKNKWKQFYYIIITGWYWRLKIGGYKYPWFWKLSWVTLIDDFKLAKAILQGKLS